MLVGVVANPASSKDIRRLTGLARVIDIEEKANLVARLLVGLATDERITVSMFDDGSGLARRAAALAGDAGPPVDYLDLEASGSEADTRKAATALAAQGAAALVTVGGDGTVRAAAEGWPRAPLVPIAAGTNNAFALTDEPTVVGVATAMAVTRRSEAAFAPTTAIEVDTSEGRALAVIDAVVVRDRWIGAGAIWRTDQLVEGFVTSSRRTAVGIASVSAALGPLAPAHARRMEFGGPSTVRAVFGPGVVKDVPVSSHVDLPLGSEIVMHQEAGLIALDGERRLPVKGGTVRVVEGPRVLDVAHAWDLP
jgi:predicted polyphosphate/ATP-dependent NAD kinase